MNFLHLFLDKGQASFQCLACGRSGRFFGQNPLKELIFKLESGLRRNKRLEIFHGLDGRKFFGPECFRFSRFGGILYDRIIGRLGGRS